jgi:hypothetical protein
MHEYDIALKSVLRRLSGSVLRELTGFTVARWHNTELPVVQNRRVDMLGETADGTLVHIELQSTNQSGMALRMLEYAAAIHRQYGRFPEQVVLYVGHARLRMKGELRGLCLDFRCRMIDIRELDGDRLIATGRVEDNVIAVLGRLSDERIAVQRVLGRIGRCGPKRRVAEFDELMFLAGLRSLGTVIEEEARRMPILNDIMDHEVIGPAIRKGRLEGERYIVLRQITRRFGPLPTAARKRIESLTAPKLERISLRLLDAGSLDELLG